MLSGTVIATSRSASGIFALWIPLGRIWLRCGICSSLSDFDLKLFSHIFDHSIEQPADWGAISLGPLLLVDGLEVVNREKTGEIFHVFRRFLGVVVDFQQIQVLFEAGIEHVIVSSCVEGDLIAQEPVLSHNKLGLLWTTSGRYLIFELKFKSKNLGEFSSKMGKFGETKEIWET